MGNNNGYRRKTSAERIEQLEKIYDDSLDMITDCLEKKIMKGTQAAFYNLQSARLEVNEIQRARGVDNTTSHVMAYEFEIPGAAETTEA